MRLIDADALMRIIDVVPLTDDGGVDINDLEIIINKQPTIKERKRGEWIPCSERLPEKNSEYLVTKVDHITDDSLLDIAVYCDWIQNNNGFYKADEVIAWMPLPEPYSGADMKGGKNE